MSLTVVVVLHVLPFGSQLQTALAVAALFLMAHPQAFSFAHDACNLPCCTMTEQVDGADDNNNADAAAGAMQCFREMLNTLESMHTAVKGRGKKTTDFTVQEDIALVCDHWLRFLDKENQRYPKTILTQRQKRRKTVLRNGEHNGSNPTAIA